MAKFNLRRVIKAWLQKTPHKNNWVVGRSIRSDVLDNNRGVVFEIHESSIELVESVNLSVVDYDIELNAADPKFFDRLDRLLTIIYKYRDREHAFYQNELRLYHSVLED